VILTPRPYQETGAQFLAARRFALLADEMRVGKTPQAILGAQYINTQSLAVVCPAIAIPQWEYELDRWWTGMPLKERAVISFDNLRNRGAARFDGWDLGIVDECHFAGNPNAGRTAAVYADGGLIWNTKRLWTLSGTPAKNHAAELWPMLRAFSVT
jgi:SNF2 family DNA or RNA helicase